MVQACVLTQQSLCSSENRNSAEMGSFILGNHSTPFRTGLVRHLHLFHLGGGAGFFCTPCLSCVCSVTQCELAARLSLKRHRSSASSSHPSISSIFRPFQPCLTGMGSMRGVRGRQALRSTSHWVFARLCLCLTATSSAALRETRHTHKLWRPRPQP